ncbi:MAG: hypothetical protein Q9177_004144 [Variospora cf. flavescens]
MIFEITIFEASDSDVDLENPQSHFKETIQQLLTTILAANGAKSAFYGQLVERAQIVVVIMNYTLLSRISSLCSCRIYPIPLAGEVEVDIFSQLILAYLASFHTLVKASNPVTVYHVPFGDLEDPSPALEAKSTSPIRATEIILTYFPLPLSGTTKDDLMASFNNFKPFFLSNGALFAIDGWAIEDNVETPVIP